MIIGIGTDLVDTTRIAQSWEQHGQRFLDRCFSSAEQKVAEKYKNKDQQISYYAKRWAAKEAVAKACGTGIGAEIGFHDIEISNDDKGKPMISLSADGEKFVKTLCAEKTPMLNLSLSDEHGFALAFVVISTE